jgi:hypothetical protein
VGLQENNFTQLTLQMYAFTCLNQSFNSGLQLASSMRTFAVLTMVSIVWLFAKHLRSVWSSVVACLRAGSCEWVKISYWLILSEPYNAIQTSRCRGSPSHDFQWPCHAQHTSRESSGANAKIPGSCHASDIR